MARAVAFEAAEMYTGLPLRGRREVEQLIASERTTRRGTVIVRLKYPTVDGIITLDAGNRNVRTVRVAPGTTRVELPVAFESMDCCASDCRVNYGVTARYMAGPQCSTDIHPGIVLGCLKYIAWTIENPGDQLVTLVDESARSGGLLTGTNNGVWGSGALELWRQYRTDLAA
jgi:hypothetical protein